MIEVHRQLKSYVESRNDTYSISFNLKEAEELLKYINRLEVRNYKLDKALDKGCETLEKYDRQNNVEMGYDDWKTKEEWKEWCLKR